MIKHTRILRWLSLIPVAFTVFVLSDWIVRFTLWWMQLPMILLEKIFGSGPIGKLMDGITDFFIGLDSTVTLTIIATGIVTGYASVYILATVAPTNNKATAKILVMIYLTLLAISLVTFIINGITGQNILWTMVVAMGILMAWHSIKHETEKESERHEKFVQQNIKRIFVLTLIVTILLVAFFLLV